MADARHRRFLGNIADASDGIPDFLSMPKPTAERILIAVPPLEIAEMQVRRERQWSPKQTQRLRPRPRNYYSLPGFALIGMAHASPKRHSRNPARTLMTLRKELEALAKVDHEIRLAGERIQRQTALTDELHRDGHDVFLAMQILALLRDSRLSLMEHRTLIVSHIDRLRRAGV